MVMVMLSMSTPILTILDAIFCYSSFIHTYHPLELGSSHVNLLGCLPCQLWRRKEGKVLKSVWQMTLLMDRCAQTPPEYQSSQLFSASTTKKAPRKPLFCHWTCGIGMLLVPVYKYDQLWDDGFKNNKIRVDNSKVFDDDDDDDRYDDKWGYKWSQ